MMPRNSTSQICLTLLFCVCSSHVWAAAGTGAGQFQVSADGSASYTMPIAVPPGTAGVQPQLALQYTSNAGNGPLGVGWNLSGLSQISRCPTILDLDGFIDPVDYDNNDKLCLGGQRLVADSGTYGNDGATYRTEIESFSKIQQFGNINSSGSWFKVWTKDGKIIEYGNGNSSTVNPASQNNTKTIIWGVNKISDRHGNYTAFHYLDANAPAYGNNLLIDEIKYTGNDATGTPPYNSVKFSYTPGRSDNFPSYYAADPFKLDYRLTGITTYADYVPVSRYDLEYGQAGASSISRINRVRQCGLTPALDCLPWTRFDWTDYTQQVGTAAQQVLSSAPVKMYSNEGKRSAAIDLNGDGLSDYVWVPDGSSHEVWAAVSDGEKLTDPKKWLDTRNLGIKAIADYNREYFFDINADGLADRVWTPGDEDDVWVALSTGTGFETPVVWLADNAGGVHAYSKDGEHEYYADLNGDGLIDRVWNPQGENDLWTALNTGSGFATPQMWLPSTPKPYSYEGRYEQPADVNGDGMADWVWAAEGSEHLYVAISSGNGFIQPQIWLSSSSISVPTYSHDGLHEEYQDLNGDGLADRIWIPNNSHDLYVALSTGSGFAAPTVWLAEGNGVSPVDGFGDSRARFYTDVNGDGLTDRVWKQGEYNFYSVAFSTGQSFTPTHPLNPTTNWVLGLNNGADFRNGNADYEYLADIDGDGRPELLYRPDGKSDVWSIQGQNTTDSSAPPNLIKGIANGLNARIDIVYKPLTDASTYTKGNSSNYPDLDVATAQYVVASYDKDGPNNATLKTSYRYTGLKANLHGRGSLGFSDVAVTDTASAISEVTGYAQDFPYTGLVTSKTTYSSTPQTLLNRVFNTLEQTVLGNGSKTRYFPHVSLSKQENYEGKLYGGVVSTQTTETDYDAYGNAETVTVTAYRGNQAYTDRHVTDVVNVYNNNPSSWLLGKLTQTTVTKTNPAGETLTRISSFTYNSVTGFLDSETVEPGTSQELKTQYTPDNFGNRASVTVSGPDIATRSSSTSYGTRGQFAETVTNALGHEEIREYDAKFGTLKKLTGPNNLATTWTYDSLGRVKLESRADGTTTATAYAFCTTQCPTDDGKFMVTVAESGGAQSMTVINRMEQQVSRSKLAYDGKWIHALTEYDPRGRVARQSAPFFASGTAYWTSYQYDALGRVVRQEKPLDETSSGGAVTTFNYDGLVITQTDALGNQSIKRNNVLGQTLSVTDALSGTVTNTYDPYGNLRTVTDPSGNITTMVYDIRGNKISMDDPDMGQWSYEYNALRELVQQTDTKDQQVSLDYDLLGRLIQRTEPEGTTQWTYDTRWIGALSESENPAGYRKALYYDDFGRPEKTWVYIDGVVYKSATSYDAQSRVNRITYPTGFQVQQTYYPQGGSLKSVVNPDTGDAYWQADAMDALGNVSLEHLGSGVSTLRAYDQSLGTLNTIISGTNNGWEVQSLNYTWDPLGNLRKRTDQNQGGLTEQFDYDPLYRLTGSTLNGMQNLDIQYDALGNITQKSGVGDYHYDASPHAVTRVTDGPRAATYTYDPNGNMLTGAQRTFTWTSDNKPRRITHTNGNRSEFFYGPDRARYKHIVTDTQGSTDDSETIFYVGKLYEQHIKASGVVEHQHFIRAGDTPIAIHTTRSNGADDTRYLHRDPLGSVDAITDESGDVVERFAFDAHGKRRGLAWTDDTADDLLTQAYTTNRGFTGHEHLDHLALIHMNGRVFDPILGRFLSADPHIQFADNTQSYNRYSYVLNNPLSATDPSGFFSFNPIKHLKKAAKKLVHVFKNVAQAATDITKGYLFLGQFSAFFYAAPIRSQFQSGSTLQGLGRFAATYFGGPVGAAGFEAYLTDINGGSFVDSLVAAGQAYALSGGRADLNSTRGDLGRSVANGLSRDGGNREASANGASSAAMANAVGASQPNDLMRNINALPEVKSQTSRISEEIRVSGKIGIFGELKIRVAALAVTGGLDLTSFNFPVDGREDFISQGFGIKVELFGKSFALGVSRISTNGGLSFRSAPYGGFQKATINKDGVTLGFGGGLGVGGDIEADLISPAN